MTQTKEQRIYKHYQSSRHFYPFGQHYNDDELILYLAKHWKMPCIEIKTIVRARQRENKLANKPKGACVHEWDPICANFFVCRSCGREKHS